MVMSAAELENLNYDNEDQQSNDRKEIHSILLLHNVCMHHLKSDKEKPASLLISTSKQNR